MTTALTQRQDLPSAPARSERADAKAPIVIEEADAREKRGRRWLVWSFMICPCHLPIIVGLLGLVFGGGAFGALMSRGSIAIGIVLTSLYAVALTIGLRHIRAANRQRSCADGSCAGPKVDGPVRA